MIVRKYKEFLLSKLFESVLLTDAEFKRVLLDMPYSSIKDSLYDMISSKIDIKTNYNGISLSDKNDEISFIPDTQFQRSISKGENPWNKTKSKSKIGRMIRQILSDNKISFTDSDIENFVNQFKTAWDKKFSSKKQIKVVTGEDIKYWYNEEHYKYYGGTLGNSCMRHKSKNEFMNLYAKNVDKISLVVLIEEDKLMGRALLWKIDDSEDGIKIYLDRIYTRYDSDCEYINDWVFENVANRKSEIFGSYQKGYSNTIKCFLKNVEFDKYPYADTFCYLYQKAVSGKVTGEGFVSNRYNDSYFENYICLELQNTDGSADIKSHRWSEHLGKYIERKYAIYVDSVGDYMDKRDLVKCNYLDSYYTKDQVIYSESMKDWIPKDRAIEHEKYGIVLDSAIKKVVTSYDESKSIFELYQDYTTGKCDFFSSEEVIYNREEHFRVPYESNIYFDKKFKVEDSNGDIYPKMLCMKLYKIEDKGIINGDMEVKLATYYTSINYYALKEIADIYDVKVDESKYIYQYISPLVSNLPHNFYIKYQKSEINKNEDFMKSLNNLKMRLDMWYKKYYDSAIKISKLDNLEEIFINLIIDSSNKSLRDEYTTELINNEFAYHDRHYDPNLTDDDKKLIIKLLPTMFIFFLIYRNSDDTTREFYKFIQEKYNSIIDEINKQGLYFAFFDGFRRTTHNYFERSVINFLRDNNLEIDRDFFIDNIKSDIDFEKLKTLIKIDI